VTAGSAIAGGASSSSGTSMRWDGASAVLVPTKNSPLQPSLTQTPESS
jgi:hypothetical protein